MNASETHSTRRNFIQKTGAAAGAVALAAAPGGDNIVHAQEINAMQPTPEQLQGFLATDFDGPLVMVNLLKFKPNGGREEYAKYSKAVVPLLEKVGGRVLFSGDAKFCLIGNAEWDAVALAEYPSPQALFQMASSAEYQEIHKFRDAGLEGQVNYAVKQNTGM